MSNVKTKNNKIKYVLWILLLLFAIIIVNELRKSLFFRNPERINILIYNKYPTVYSLGLKDKINYKINFYPDLKIEIPGGYGLYRVGAIGKLVKLEKKPDIFKKTFSLVTFSFVDYYFFPLTDEIYYGNESENPENQTKLASMFFFKSNANFFDRLYLLLVFYPRRNSDFTKLELINGVNSDKDRVLLVDDLYKSFLGYFYRSQYRQEKQNLQLVYSNNYQTASALSRIIEGNGIRVVDIGWGKLDNKIGCLVIGETDKFSQTAKDLSDFFKCQLKKGRTEVSDIIFNLNNVEKEWEINQ